MAPRRNDDGFRTQMLRAAAALIAERGYDGVRIADIAAACGASTGSVHYHFSGRDEILTAALALRDPAGVRPQPRRRCAASTTRASGSSG